jgi:archaellum component FlaC
MAVRIPIITDFDGRGLQKSIEAFKQLETNGEKATFLLRKSFLPATAAIAGLTAGLVMSSKAAAEDQAAQAQLARQLQATTGATDKQIQANEDFITTLSRSAAIADDELRPALGNLVRATGDITTAQDLLKISLDVAAGTGKSLAEVSDAVSKAYAGNTKAIKNLSPELFQLIKDGASADEIFQQLSKTFGGAAATAADTAQGKFKNLTIQLGEAKEAIGTALLPVVEIMVGAFTNFAIWAQNNAGVILGIATAIGAIAAAIIGTNIALAAWKTVSVITMGINYALAASFTAVQIATGIGIAVVIAGVAAFALYQRQMNGLKGTLGAFNTEQGYSNSQLQRMSDNGELATKSLGGFDTAATGAGGAVDKMAEKIKKAREELKDQFSTALDEAKEKLEKAKTAYDDFKKTVSESVTGEFSISGAADAAKEAGTSILNQLTQQANGAKAFGKQVEQLLEMGLSENALSKVLEAGQEAGSAIAKELILGGSEAITGPNGINQLVSDLNYVADALGTLAADKFYKAGVTQGEQYLAGVQSAIQAAEMLLKNPNLKLADVKGIGAKFAGSVSSISLGPTTAPTFTGDTSGIMAERGGNNYTVNINGGVLTNAQTGKVVIDAVKSFNRASGPADISVRPISGRY